MSKKSLSSLLAVVAVVALVQAGYAFTTGELEEAGVSFTGYVETELSYVSADEGDVSDIAVAEVSLGTEYAPADWILASVILLYEDGADGVGVDEAFVTLGGSDLVPVKVTVGRIYPKFGSYSSLYCSGLLCEDSLAQSLSETREEVVQVAYRFGPGTVRAGVANGAVDEVGKDDGFSLFYGIIEVTPLEGLTVGTAYTSNLGTSSVLSELMPEEGVEEIAAGLTLYAIYQAGRFYGQADYVTALDRFSAVDLDADGDGVGDEPSALNIEVGYEVLADVQLGARYASSDEFADFPEEQYGLVVNYALFDGAVLAVEYLHNELPGGGDEETLSGRVAVEF